VIATEPVTVRMIAFLDAHCKECGRPTKVTLDVPEDGITARRLAEDLELPMDRIEGVFLNHTERGLEAIVRPGDRVAFVPYGTPASHPAFFGEFSKPAH